MFGQLQEVFAIRTNINIFGVDGNPTIDSALKPRNDNHARFIVVLQDVCGVLQVQIEHLW